MSHTWSGFGLLLIATILHSFGLTVRCERLYKAKKPLMDTDTILNGLLCILSWLGLTSALRVVISPSRGIIPQCELVESVPSSCTLALWAINTVVMEPFRNDTANTKYPKTIVAASFALFIAVAVLCDIFKPSTGRIGMLCFFEATWLHIFLQVWFFRELVITFRYGNKRSTNRAMRVVDDEDRFFWQSSEGLYALTCGIIAAASLSLLIAYAVVGSRLGGGVAFWEFWLLITGMWYTRQEWSRIEL